MDPVDPRPTGVPSVIHPAHSRDILPSQAIARPPATREGDGARRRDQDPSNIWLHSRVNPGHVPYSWKILLSGYLPEFLYQRGKLDDSVPFEVLQRRAEINALAQAADKSPEFSERIREHSAPNSR